MLKRSYKRFITIMVVVLLLAVNVSTVFAAPPKGLHIDVVEFFLDATPEPFTASGSAVDDGLVCAYGTVADFSNTVVSSGGPFTIIKADKHFVCGDGSGTFDVKMNIKLDNVTGQTTAKWKVTGGTLAYSSLKGNGSLVGIPLVPGSIISDFYDGKVH